MSINFSSLFLLLSCFLKCVNLFCFIFSIQFTFQFNFPYFPCSHLCLSIAFDTLSAISGRRSTSSVLFLLLLPCSYKSVLRLGVEGVLEVVFGYVEALPCVGYLKRQIPWRFLCELCGGMLFR